MGLLPGVTGRAGEPLVSEGVPVSGESLFRPGVPAGLSLGRGGVVPGVEESHESDQVKVGGQPADGMHIDAQGDAVPAGGLRRVCADALFFGGQLSPGTYQSSQEGLSSLLDSIVKEDWGWIG